MVPRNFTTTRMQLNSITIMMATYMSIPCQARETAVASRRPKLRTSSLVSIRQRWPRCPVVRDECRWSGDAEHALRTKLLPKVPTAVQDEGESCQMLIPCCELVHLQREVHRTGCQRLDREAA